MVRLKNKTSQKINEIINKKIENLKLRIDLNFSGCCEPSLRLQTDNEKPGDLKIKVDGLTFIISDEVYRICGDITIEYIDEKSDGKCFRITSEKPVSEWAGTTCVGIDNI